VCAMITIFTNRVWVGAIPPLPPCTSMACSRTAFYISIMLLAEPLIGRIRFYHYCWRSYLPADRLNYRNLMQHDNIFNL
jgi:hypothetical protein